MAEPQQIVLDAAIMAVAPELGASLMLNHLTNFLLRSVYKQAEHYVGNTPDSEALTRIADAMYSEEDEDRLADTVKMRVGMPDELHIHILNTSELYQTEQELVWESVF